MSQTLESKTFLPESLDQDLDRRFREIVLPLTSDDLTEKDKKAQAEASKTEWFETKGYEKGFSEKSTLLEAGKNPNENKHLGNTNTVSINKNLKKKQTKKK